MNSMAAIAKPCLGTRSIMGYLHVLSAKRLQCARHFKVGAADASHSLKVWKSVHSVGCCPFLDEAEGENFDDFIKENAATPSHRPLSEYKRSSRRDGTTAESCH
jgi:hypothetical protein